MNVSAHPPPAENRYARSGRSRARRLHGLDAWVSQREAAWVRAWAGEAWAVDVGVGDSPESTWAWQAALRAVDPRAKVLAVDVDPARVAAAGRFQAGALESRVGDFHALVPGERSFLVRAMNVLRGYPLEALTPAYQKLCAGLVEGGLLLEGSTDREGHVLAAHLVRPRGGALVREALLFHTDFTRGFSPWLFRDVLPRDLRRDVRPGQPVHAFLSDWEGAWEAVRGTAVSPQEAFWRSGEALAARRADVDGEAWALQNGYLCWRTACTPGLPLPPSP